MGVFFEAELLHDGHAEHVVAQLFLVDDERDVALILSQECEYSLVGLSFAAELLCFANVQLA